jgi:hypothetical protein
MKNKENKKVAFSRTPRRGLNHFSDSPFFPRRSTPLSVSQMACGAITKVQLSEAKSR